MRLEVPTAHAEAFAVGDTVSVEDGPLKGFIGSIKAVNSSAGKATIVTSMFGRNTEVEVDFVQIEKVNAEIPQPSEDDAE